MVHRARSVSVESGALLGHTTTQAVLFSALTTLASFGTLVLSDHRGIASLGELLVIGMTFTLVGNLVLLPALLILWQRRRGRSARIPASE
jgi:predicted RND superfamily exporter protein